MQRKGEEAAIFPKKLSQINETTESGSGKTKIEPVSLFELNNETFELVLEDSKSEQLSIINIDLNSLKQSFERLSKLIEKLSSEYAD